MIILCFHKVGPFAREGRRLNVEPASLALIIRWLKRRGHVFVLAKDLDAGLYPKGVALTFDDAYVSTMTHGVEVMEREKVRGSIYAVPAFVGGGSEWDKVGPAPLATFAQLREAEAKGFEIGNHTDSHPRLGELDLEAQTGHILAGQEWLHREGLHPGSFCFPYGSLNSDSVHAVARAGLSVGLALGKRNPEPRDDLRALPRVVVSYSDGVLGVAYKVYVKPRIYRMLGRTR